MGGNELFSPLGLGFESGPTPVLPLEEVEKKAILRALDELPHRLARSVIDKIQGQAQPQVEELSKATPAEPQQGA